jgi:hypothetical protein
MSTSGASDGETETDEERYTAPVARRRKEPSAPLTGNYRRVVVVDEDAMRHDMAGSALVVFVLALTPFSLVYALAIALLVYVLADQAMGARPFRRAVLTESNTLVFTSE